MRPSCRIKGIIDGIVHESLPIFLISAVLISLSGVVSPGPMTVATVQQGGRSPANGLLISLGHGAVEIPLIFLIALGAGALLRHDSIRMVIAAAGGLFLLYMGWGLLVRRKGGPSDVGTAAPRSFITGMLLSIGNPWFLLWWGTVGVNLVIGAVAFGMIGLILFAVLHWLTDVLWYGVLAFASYRGTRLLGERVFGTITAICGLVMLFYGGLFLFEFTKMVRTL